MEYRVSLHILATIWHCLLLSWAWSRRRTDCAYAALLHVTIASALFTAAWTVGIGFSSLTAMRFTWIGALWPAATLEFIDQIFGASRPKWMRVTFWTCGAATAVAGMTPWCIVSITHVEPTFAATVGWIEPILRVSLGLQVVVVIWTSIKLFLTTDLERPYFATNALLGLLVYGAGALVSSALFPLLGEYRFLEPTSYGSVVWSTFSLWLAYKDSEQKNHVLSELNELKKNLINHVTHELRTPLNAISSAVEMISEVKTVEDPKFRDYSRMIALNADRLSHFVDELLDVAKLQQAKVTIQPKACDLLALAKDVSSRLAPVAERKDVAVQVDGSETEVVCDPRKIEQVITNLLSNAIKASEGGTIRVTAVRSGEQASLSVQDFGIGIPSEHLPNIFSSFYQVSLGKTAHKGVGLGLAIAKGLVETHGGRIWAESGGVGKGTTVTFTLPGGQK